MKSKKGFGIILGILGKERVFFPAYKRAYILTEIEDLYYKYDHKTKSLNEFSTSLIQKIKKLGVRKPNQPSIFKIQQDLLNFPNIQMPK